MQETRGRPASAVERGHPAAARMPLDIDTQAQLLAIAAMRGRATQVYARFTPLVADLLGRSSSSSSRTADAQLLHAAFGARLESRVKAELCVVAPTTKRSNELSLSADVERQYAAFAAKLAQSVIKAYAAAVVTLGATDADKKSSAFGSLADRLTRTRQSAC